MNDRELMELAAKAAGYRVVKQTMASGFIRLCADGGPNQWNPLADDGDALRLAVKLGMNVEINDNYVLACTYGNFSEPSKPDQYAAARRAITRAAAAMASNGETV